MTLECVCLEQQEIIAKQGAIISALLQEIALHRALDAEEQALLKQAAPGTRELIRKGDARI